MRKEIIEKAKEPFRIYLNGVYYLVRKKISVDDSTLVFMDLHDNPTTVDLNDIRSIRQGYPPNVKSGFII